MKTVKELGYFPIFIFAAFGIFLFALFAGENSKSNPPDGKCELYKITGPSEVCVDKEKEFCAIANVAEGKEDSIVWSADGGTFVGKNTGLTVKIKWDEPGEKEVYAACGSGENKYHQVLVVELHRIIFKKDGEEISVACPEDYIDLEVESTPDGRNIEWSILGDDLGCSISSGQLVCGTETGTITIQAKDTGTCGGGSETGDDTEADTYDNGTGGGTGTGDDGYGDDSSEEDECCCVITRDLVIQPCGDVDVTFSALNTESVKEEEQGAPHETSPHGGFICINDNDNAKSAQGNQDPPDGEGNDIQDIDDTNLTSADPDLLNVSFTFPDEDGYVSLTYPSYIKAWKENTKINEITTFEFEWPDDRGTMEQFYIVSVSGDKVTAKALVEAVDDGSGSSIKINWVPSSGEESQDDSANVYAVKVDIDIDSDNTNDFGDPDLSEEEDRLELLSDDGGKKLEINNTDLDGDGVQDYFDGFNANGEDGDDDDEISASTDGETPKFVPVKFEIPSVPDHDKIEITFDYADSDPAAVIVSGSGSGTTYELPDDPNDEKRLRLWTKDASEKRDKNNNFIASGTTYTIQELVDSHDLEMTGNIGTLYVEAIKNITKQDIEEKTIKVTLKGEDSGSGIKYECKDSIIVGTGFEFDLAISVSEPNEFLEEEEPIKIVAHNVINLSSGAAREGLYGINFNVGYSKPDKVDGQELTVTIKVEAEAGGDNQKNEKLMEFLENAVQPNAGKMEETITLIDGEISGSREFALFTSYEFDNKPWVHAGDTFTITATMEATLDGEELEVPDPVTLEFVVVPGPAEYYIVTDDPTNVPNPTEMWNVTDDSFISQFENFKVEFPAGSEEQLTFHAFYYDVFRNSLPEGTTLEASLEGPGFTDFSFNPRSSNSDDLKNTAGKEIVLNAQGMATLKFKQEFFPHCPWNDPAENKKGGHVYHTVITGSDYIVNSSKVRSTYEIPEVPAPRLEVNGLGVGELDLNKAAPNRSLDIEAILTIGGEPLPNVEIKFTSTNGKLTNRLGVTDANGRVTTKLTAEDARIGLYEVHAYAPGMHETLFLSNTQWIDSSPVTLEADVIVITADQTRAQGNGWVAVEVFLDKDNTAFLNDVFNKYKNDYNLPPVPADAGNTNDGKMYFPSFRESKMKLKGLPNHVYEVSGITTADVSVTTPTDYYPFEASEGNQSDSVTTANTSIASQQEMFQIDGGQAQLGIGFVEFDNVADNLEIPQPGEKILETGGSLEFSFRKGSDLNENEIIFSSGNINLVLDSSDSSFNLNSLNDSGVVVDTARSDLLFEQNTWYNIEIRYEAQFNKYTLFVSNSVTQDGKSFIATIGIEAEDFVFGGFTGLLDEVRVKYRPRSSVTFRGVSEDGTVTTDANGYAEFYAEWEEGTWNIAQHLEEMNITVSGSTAAKAKVKATRKSFWGELCGLGRAVLFGSEAVSENAGFFTKLAGWVSDSIPFVSDLRTIGMEVYKGFSGCDKVSKANVTFAIIGLAADIFTFGLGGTAVKAGSKIAKVFTSGLFKVALKKAGKEIGKIGATNYALEKTIAYLTQVASDVASDLPEDHWVFKVNTYIEKKLNNTLDNIDAAKDSLLGTITSVGTLIDAAFIYDAYGIDIAEP